MRYCLFLIIKYQSVCCGDICRIPDFQKTINESYVAFLKNIFINLIKNDFQIPESWFANKIIRLDEYSGGIEELTSKIANIRTWTYISNQLNWIENSQYWQKKNTQHRKQSFRPFTYKFNK